jgi:hypothetical protein
MQLRVRYGDGTDNVLKKTKAGDAQALDLEITILEGPHAKSKIFWFALVEGTTDGQKSMIDRNLALLKKIIDSGKYIDPNDRSPEAHRARTMQWRDFDGFRFLGEVGIEPGKDGFADKNVIAKAITRDQPAWNGRPPLEQIASGAGRVPSSTAAPQAAPQAAPPIARPAWASSPPSPPSS